MNRIDAISYSKKQNDNTSIIISISCNSENFPNIETTDNNKALYAPNIRCYRYVINALNFEIEEKEDRKLELFDNILFGEKMIARGEATREELQSQFDEIEKELKKLN